MPEATERFLGCRIAPPGPSEKSIEPHLRLGAALPENFLVTAWKGAYSPSWQRISAFVRARILDQGPQDSCVGHGTGVLEGAKEGVKMSPRDIFRLAKSVDGDPNGWGTTIAAAMQAVAQFGAAEDALINDDPVVTKEQYRSQQDVTPQVLQNRSRHRGRQPFFGPRARIREMLLQYDLPVVTSCMWHVQDNRMPDTGIMRPASSEAVGGHCFACVGWLTRNGVPHLIMVNSFGPDWGADGLFFVPLDGTEQRLGNGYMALDIMPTTAEVVALYEGRDVKVIGTPDLYRVTGGKKRKYPNERMWWMAANAFGQDTFDISATDLAALPDGGEMTPADVPPTVTVTREKMAEIIRQIAQHYGG